MLRLRFSIEDIARTRFASSPLWEVVTSVQALKEPSRRALHLNWRHATRQRLGREGVGFQLLDSLVPIPSYYVPDFLTLVPDTATPSLDQELAAVAETRSDVVRADLERMPTPWHPLVTALYRDPVSGLARLVREIRDYWGVALLPHWPRIQRLLEAEVLYRARVLAHGGAAALFQGLHPQVSWQESSLRVAHPGYEATQVLDAGRGLVLVPSVFVWPGVFSQSNPPGQPGLVYPPRGIGQLWDSQTPWVPRALAGVMGRSRARLLVELDVPASTSELSSRLRMSAPNVSHHLTTLRKAGLVAAHRVGPSVLYLRTPAGETLIDAGDPG